MNKPTISIQILRHVVNCLRLTGHDPDRELAARGLFQSSTKEPDGVMLLEDFLEILELAAKWSGNANFGLHAGRLGASDSLGPLGFLFLSAPTFRSAFASFNAYLSTIQDATRNSFYEEDGIATFEYGIADERLQNRTQDAEYSISVMHNFCQNYVGSDFVLSEVRFEHACASHPRVYRDFFRCDVFFEQEVNAFSFESRFLDKVGGAIEPGLFPIIEEHVRRLADGHAEENSMSDRVKMLVDASPLHRNPTLQQVAQRLGVSVSTLNRQLQVEGVVWRTLIQERKMTAAARLLKQSKRDVADIAQSIGFAESASFVRSFRRYFGQTPKRYRDDHSQQGAS